MKPDECKYVTPPPSVIVSLLAIRASCSFCSRRLTSPHLFPVASYFSQPPPPPPPRFPQIRGLGFRELYGSGMAGVGGEVGVDLRLLVYFPDGTAAGEYRLVPRWEFCSPQPTGGSAVAVPGDDTASPPSSGGTGLPVAPPLPEELKLNLTLSRRGELVASIPLVPSNSLQSVRDLQSIEGISYIHIEIRPHDRRAIVRLYEVGPEINWKSTGVYTMDQAYPKQDLVSYSYPEHLFGNKPVYFHGKECVEIQFPPMKMNFRKNFQHEKMIGKGTEGKVYRCSSNFSSQYFAVKEVDQQNILIRQVDCEPSDVSVLAMLGHKNVIELYLAWSEAKKSGRYGYVSGSVFVAIKPCTRSLMQYLKEISEIDLETSEYIFRQLMEGLAFIHERGIVHRDIKPGNVLLEALTVKITDFGIAKVKQPPYVLEFAGGVYGSLPYRAPEIINVCTRHNEKVDIFSAGMVYFELFMPGLHERKAKLNQLSKIIRERAQEFDQLGQDFNLDLVLNGTNTIDGWKGNLELLKKMTNPKRSFRNPGVY